MYFGRVVGSVWATVKHPHMTGSACWWCSR